MPRYPSDRGNYNHGSNSLEYPSNRNCRSSYYENSIKDRSQEKYSKTKSFSRNLSSTRCDRGSPELDTNCDRYRNSQDHRYRSPKRDERHRHDNDRSRSSRRDSFREHGRNTSYETPSYRKSNYNNDRRQLSDSINDRKRQYRSPFRHNDSIETIRAAQKTVDSLNSLSYFDNHLPSNPSIPLPRRSGKILDISPGQPAVLSTNYNDSSSQSYSREPLHFRGSRQRLDSSPRLRKSNQESPRDKQLFRSPTYFDYPYKMHSTLSRSHSNFSHRNPLTAFTNGRDIRQCDNVDSPIHSEYSCETLTDVFSLSNPPKRQVRDTRRLSSKVDHIYTDPPKHPNPSYDSPLKKQSHLLPNVDQSNNFGSGANRFSTNKILNKSNSNFQFDRECVDFSFRPPSSPEDVEMLDLSDTIPISDPYFTRTVTPGMPSTPVDATVMQVLSGLFKKPSPGYHSAVSEDCSDFLQSMNLSRSRRSTSVVQQLNPVPPSAVTSRHVETASIVNTTPSSSARYYDFELQRSPLTDYTKPLSAFDQSHENDQFKIFSNGSHFQTEGQKSPFLTQNEFPAMIISRFSPQVDRYESSTDNYESSSPEAPSYSYFSDEEVRQSPEPPTYDYGSKSDSDEDNVNCDTLIMPSIAKEVDPTHPINVNIEADAMASFEDNFLYPSKNDIEDRASIPSPVPPIISMSSPKYPTLAPKVCSSEMTPPLQTIYPSLPCSSDQLSKPLQSTPSTYRCKLFSTSSCESDTSTSSATSFIDGKEYLIDCLRSVDTIEDVLLDYSLVEHKPERVYAGSIVHLSFKILLDAKERSIVFDELLSLSDIFGVTIGCEPRFASNCDKINISLDNHLTIKSYMLLLARWTEKERNKHHLIAIGPCGFDDKVNGADEWRRVQHPVFKFQAQLAVRFKIPLIVTTRGRKAFDQLIVALKDTIGTNHEIHYTGFNGSSADAQHLLHQFPKMQFGIQHDTMDLFNIRDVINDLPLSALLIESGKNKSNSINNAYLVAERIARSKRIPIDELLKSMILNAKNFYGL